MPVLSLNAQNNTIIDSITRVVQTTKEDRIKAISLAKLAHEYIDLDAHKAFLLASQSLELASTIKDKESEVAALNELSHLEKNGGDYSKALATLKSAIRIAELSGDTISIIRSFISVGDVYSALLNYNKALSYYEEALTLNNNKKNVQAISCLNRIGNRLMDKGREANDTTFIASAIASYLKAKDIAAAIHHDKHYINAFVSLADAYNIFGKVSNNKHHLYESLNYSMMSLQLARVANLKSSQGISYLNLGEVYLSLNKTIKALHYFEMAEKIYLPLGSKSWLLNTYKLMGKTYYTMHVYDKAAEYINKSITLGKEQQLIQHLRDDYQLLAEIFTKQQKFEQACEYYRIFNNYKDSVINENTSFNISRLQTELDLQRKDKEIAFLTKNTEAQIQEINSKKNQRNTLVLVVFAVLIALIFVYYLYHEKKKVALEILKAKEIAEKSKEAQEQFLANTSHEIRTPMNGIIGMTNHLIDTPLSKEQKEYVGAIKESSNNLLSIINELLDLSKIMAKKILFDKQPFEPGMIIKNLAHLLEFRVVEKNLRLTYHLDPAIPKIITGDAIRLNQILLNLVENSVKFTRDGEIYIHVALLVETEDSVELEFSVKDTGIGIPENKLNFIFENFTQVNAKTNRKYDGTGLGLSISKQLIEQQGGTIAVQSKMGVGSTFTFNLEFKKLKSTTEFSNENLPLLSEIPAANLNGISILVVDDNKINLKVALLTLQKWNVNIQLAENAKDAYITLATKKIDLILMDITMPEIDGFEATQYIRTNFDVPVSRVPIIAMTAAAFIGDKEKCLHSGMNDYLSKPFAAQDLLYKIRTLLPEQTSYQKTSLSDLSLIYERADGDKEFLKDILGCYIAEMPGYIKEMEDYISTGDYTGIYKQAHKMKAPIALMGAIGLKDLYAEIEINARQHKDLDLIIKQIEVAQQQCLETVEELKSEFLKL